MKGKRPIKCTRCRHKMTESDLVEKRTKKSMSLGYAFNVCPRCGCQSYYDLTPYYAWCWASGLIELDEQPPKDESDGSGSIVFAYGPICELKPFVEVMARHGKGNSAGKLLVPGVPEAPDQDAAFDALDSWVARCSEQTGRRSELLFGDDARAKLQPA